jgi:lipopolysaccharide export system protein LptC
MTKRIKIVAIIALVALVGYGIWWASQNRTEPEVINQQEEIIVLPDDTTQSIDDAIQNIDVEGIDDEFGDIDELIDQL